MTPEQLAFLKTEIRNIGNLANAIYERTVVIAHKLEESGKGCAHPRKVNATMMGSPNQQFRCPDCQAVWEEPWPEAKPAEGA